MSVYSGDAVSTLPTPANPLFNDNDPTALMMISSGNNYYIKTQINEIDATKIKEGQKIIINIDAFRDKDFIGNLDRMDEVGTNNQGVVSYNVWISFDHEDYQIKPGMSTTVKIETTKKENVLTVPLSAIYNKEGTTVVKIVSNGETKDIPVKTGIISNGQIEILEGLYEDQEILKNYNDPKENRSIFGNNLNFGE